MIAAVLVLYNPDKLVSENIVAYVDFVDKIYIIDNSPAPNERLFDDLLSYNKIEYIFNKGNLGIAKALNIGCDLAKSNGSKWVITMDQDSKFLNLNENIKKQIISSTDNKIALYYPNYFIKGVLYDKYIIEDNLPIVVMTSGNLINLDIYSALNGFDDKLFIDYVDVDYCLKIKEAGYKIVNLPELSLVHELGHSKHISFLGLKIIVTNHSALRRYYITRNRLYVKSKYKQVSSIFNKIEKRVFINDILKIILFEEDKVLKIKNMLKAYSDFRKDKFGAYN